MPVYSHNRLATYENCSQQYKLSYIVPVMIIGSKGDFCLPERKGLLLLKREMSASDMHFHENAWLS